MKWHTGFELLPYLTDPHTNIMHYPRNGGSMSLQYFGKHLQDYIAPMHSEPQTTFSTP
jgi:hypothetical protein